MPFISREKNQSPSNSAPANRLASQSQGGQQSQFPTKSQSQSHSKSPQLTQQSQPLSPWSAHTPPSGKWPSPFPRRCPALSTTATAAGELFLFGGMTPDRIYNDQYVISTRDFSTTLLQTSGDIPNPRYGHSAVLTSTIFFIWGGIASFKEQYQTLDDSLYLLNLVSREWTRIVINGPGPGGRYYHTMTLVGSKLFVFGGQTTKMCFNDIWVLDLNCLESNPFWESFDPAPENEKPLPRDGHVSVTTGDRIIIFGGGGDKHFFNDTWSFNISTRKWTELQCTGSIPSPRAANAAVLVDGIMYIFGGLAPDGTKLGDLNAFNLSTQRWIAFQDMAPSPSGRCGHAMACDGTRVFVLGGKLSRDAHGDESKLIHVLDIKQLVYSEPDPSAVNPSEKTVRKSSPSPPTRDQPHQPSSSLSDTQALHGASPFQNATSEELDHPTSREITRERNPSLNSLPSRPTGASGKSRRVPAEDDDGEDSTEDHANLVAPDLPGKEIARLENGRIIELERQLSETKTERDRRIAQLIDELALKSALLEQVEANAAEEKKRARLESRELRAKLDESLLSRDHPPDKAEVNAAEEKKRAGRELRELQAKLDESLLSRDHALEQAKSALQKAFCAAEANDQSKRELIEMRAELEASKSELAAFRLRLADTENGGSKNNAEADTYRRTQTATGLVNTDVDRVVHRLLERMQAMEAEIATLRWNEKSFEMMECRNEG